jgi:hypothetical protein
MNKKIIIAGILLTIGAAALIVAGPALAHPYWDEETEQYYPWWDVNKTYPMPHWDLNGTYTGSMWNGTGQMPYWGEDYCPGPYWADPDANPQAPYSPPEDAPRRGYGCGGMGGYGGRGGGSRRGATRWSG